MDYEVLYKIMVFMSAQDKPNTKKFSNIFIWILKINYFYTENIY